MKPTPRGYMSAEQSREVITTCMGIAYPTLTVLSGAVNFGPGDTRFDELLAHLVHLSKEFTRTVEELRAEGRRRWERETAS